MGGGGSSKKWGSWRVCAKWEILREPVEKSDWNDNEKKETSKTELYKMKVRVEDKEIDGKNGANVRLHMGPTYMAECWLQRLGCVYRSMV